MFFGIKFPLSLTWPNIFILCHKIKRTMKTGDADYKRSITFLRNVSSILAVCINIWDYVDIIWELWILIINKFISNLNKQILPEPWATFLVSDIPNIPRKQYGSRNWPLYTLVGPRSFLHSSIAFACPIMCKSIQPLKIKLN